MERWLKRFMERFMQRYGVLPWPGALHAVCRGVRLILPFGPVVRSNRPVVVDGIEKTGRDKFPQIALHFVGVLRSLKEMASSAGNVPPFSDARQSRLNQSLNNSGRNCCSFGSLSASSYARHQRLRWDFVVMSLSVVFVMFDSLERKTATPGLALRSKSLRVSSR